MNLTMPKVTMPKIDIDMKKVLPVLLLGALILAGFSLFIVYQNTLDPAVIEAQANAMEKEAALAQAKAEWWKSFGGAAPSVAVSFGYSAVGIMLGLGILTVLVSLSGKIVLRSLTDAVDKGFAYVSDGPNGTTTKYVVSPQTVVAAHLAAKYGPDAIAAIPSGIAGKPTLIDATTVGKAGGSGEPQVRPSGSERASAGDGAQPSAGTPKTAAGQRTNTSTLRDAAANAASGNRTPIANTHDHAGSSVSGSGNGNAKPGTTGPTYHPIGGRK